MLLFAVILFLIDLYAFQAVRTAFRSNIVTHWAYWIFSVVVYASLLYLLVVFDRDKGPHNDSFQYIMALLILSLVPKLILILFMFGEDIWRVFSGGARKIAGSPGDFLASRRQFVSQTALILAAIPFAGIIHGVIRGRYNYRVVQQTLSFKDLPEEFDGFRITHISDIHSGSFDNPNKIRHGVDLINEQQSDIILFTGDLVNSRASEMEPWVDMFSQLKAPMGKFSVLGNHDYGDYVDWESPQAKQENMEQLYGIHQRLGFNLLRNESVHLEKGNASIDLIGVENWGTGGFVQHGDLDRATKALDEDSFKVLMSHDPSHFDAVVKRFSKFIHLTLSGHTHGMQFGIEIPGFLKWSPVKYRYPKWAGLYKDLGRMLYVNRGFGFLAFPGRVGIWPEVTVITLKKDA